VDQLLRTWVPDTVDPGSKVVVPTIRFDLARRFAGLEGGELEGVPGSRLARFESRVRFELSERGASVAAESVVVFTLGLHPEVVFDRPFLVALRRVGAPQPYLLLWVGNDTLLERWAPRATEPADPKTLAALVGRWTIDAEATIDANVLRARDLGLLDLTELGFAEGATPSDAEVVAAARRTYAEVLRKPTGTFEVGADGDARLEMSVGGDAAREATHVRKALTLSRLEGTHWFAPRLPPGSTKDVDPEDRFRVVWNGTELRLVSGEGVIVLRRAP
jgi:hypothetical protein